MIEARAGSHEAAIDAAREAISGSVSESARVVATFDDHVVVVDGGRAVSVPYSISEGVTEAGEAAPAALAVIDEADAFVEVASVLRGVVESCLGGAAIDCNALLGIVPMLNGQDGFTYRDAARRVIECFRKDYGPYLSLLSRVDASSIESASEYGFTVPVRRFQAELDAVSGRSLDGAAPESVLEAMRLDVAKSVDELSCSIRRVADMVSSLVFRGQEASLLAAAASDLVSEASGIALHLPRAAKLAPDKLRLIELHDRVAERVLGLVVMAEHLKTSQERLA